MLQCWMSGVSLTSTFLQSCTQLLTLPSDPNNSAIDSWEFPLSLVAGWFKNRTGTENQNRRNRFSRNRKRNRNSSQRFSRNRNRNRLLLLNCTETQKSPSPQEPPEPKPGTARTVPPPNRNQTEPNRGHPVVVFHEFDDPRDWLDKGTFARNYM